MCSSDLAKEMLDAWWDFHKKTVLEPGNEAVKGTIKELSRPASKEEIEKMKNEAKANEDADNKAREQAEKANMIDSLIFQTEKQMKEVGDKIPADKKAAIETALADLKKAKESNDAAAMDKAAETLNNAWQAASQDIYNATQQQQQASTDAGNANTGADTNNNVSDVGGSNTSSVVIDPNSPVNVLYPNTPNNTGVNVDQSGNVTIPGITDTVSPYTEYNITP